MSLEIAIDKDQCKRCGICADACPIPCFYQVGKEIEIVHPNLCIVCRNCVDSCPTGCIRVALDEEAE